MITYLKVRNLAIVEEFAIELSAGLTVLTGETGAGKSLLIDSLQLLSGSRSSVDLIRSGEDRLTAEAVLEVPDELAVTLEAAGIEFEPDQPLELIIRRELGRNGRGRVTVNGALSTVRDLGSLMAQTIEIHGQNATGDRLAGRSIRELLDEYAGTRDATAGLARLWNDWRAAALDLDSLRKSQQELSQRVDMLRFQIDELSSSKLRNGEEEELRSERSILSHARELIAATSAAFSALEDSEDSALTQIARAEHLLAPLSTSIGEVAAVTGELADIRYRLSEVARTAASLAESTRLDPERLEEIEERLVTIERMRRKYGGSEESALTHFAAAQDEYDRLVDFDVSLSTMEKTETTRFERYRDAADIVSAKRVAAARKMESAVQRELADLAMEGTSVRMLIETAPEEGSRLRISGRPVWFGPEGYDRIEILIAANKGEELKPLHKVASGGELSRIQLAIATATIQKLARAGGATLVFDEIDSGVGGRVAEAVGRKLRGLAERHQVICVTHLPQIASLGTTHFRVWKQQSRDRTRASIERLETIDARIEEIARMLGGEKVGESARRHAAELLQAGVAETR